ncbi:MAG TPA: immunoglobulin domain-containing protein, partial [Verrucomicrobiae bacterium]
GANNISNAPVFVNAATGNYHLFYASPGVDAGNNALSPATNDLDGLARVVNSTVDLGAYEFQNTPFFITQPLSQIRPVTSNVLLSALAVGQPTPGLQWYYQGTALTNDSHHSGVTSSNLLISSARTNDSGNYYVVATNSLGLTTSLVASVSILVPPALIVQPSDSIVPQNSPVTLSTTISGDAPLTCQWYKNGNPLTFDIGFLDIITTSNNLVIPSAQWYQIGSYQIVVSNPAGSVTSSVAQLTVLTPPIQDGFAAPFTALIGGSGSFNVSAYGTPPLTYQWLKNGTNLNDSERLTGSHTTTLNFSQLQMSDQAVYQLVITNAYGAITSSPTPLTMVPILAWGDNTSGQTNVPLTAPDTLQIAAGGDFGLALNSSGQVRGWGNNWAGQATGLSSQSGVIAIAAGYSHSLALLNNGKVVAKGDNSAGEITVPTSASNVVAIAAGYISSVALRSNGTVVCWGWNAFGQSIVPTGLTNVVAIAAGFAHHLAVTIDGQIIGWGYNNYGQASPPSGLSNVVAVAAAEYYSLALKSDGTVTAWGYGDSGQTNVPPGLSNVVAIAAENSYALAFKNDGTVVGWGNLLPTPFPSSLSNVVAVAAGGDPANGVAFMMAQVANPAVAVPPQIGWQPPSRTLPTGQNTLLKPIVYGALPLRYQWLQNGTNLPGETNAWLMLSAIQPAQVGNYQFTVANNFGAITSQVTVVSESPVLLSQPTDQAILLTSNVTFSVSGYGVGPLNYQWYHNGSPITDGPRSSGAATATLQLSNLQTNDAGTYQVVLTNLAGAVTSSVANLTVLVPAIVTVSPTNRLSPVTSNISLTVSAQGTAPLSYRWYANGILLTNGGRITGATTATLALSNVQTNDSGTYQAIVTNNYGVSTSLLANLTIYIPVSILNHPVSQAAGLGSNVAFTVTALGTGPLAYQWFFNGTALSDGSRIGGSTSATLNLSTIQPTDAGNYSVQVSNSYGSALSWPAALTPQAVLGASLRYVNLSNSSPQSPYLDWNTAATNIQDAIDAAVAGDSVLVSNGVYATGGRAVFGVTTNRIAITKAILVTSLNGPTVTTIKGDYAAGNRLVYVRGAYVGAGAILSGFTVTNGGVTSASTNLLRDGSGAGIWGEASTSVITNCILTGNQAGQYGGGAYQGTLINCVLTNNSAFQGAGAYSNTLWNCTLIRNVTFGQDTKNAGGGAWGCVLSNCLVIANRTTGNGGGAGASFLTSCVVSNNTAVNGAGLAQSTAIYSLISSNRASGNGGGVYSNLLQDCILRNNVAAQGGGAFAATVYNCTVVSNFSTSLPASGGINGGTVFNSIVYDNGGNITNVTALAYTCTTPLLNPGGFTNAP